MIIPSLLREFGQFDCQTFLEILMPQEVEFYNKISKKELYIFA